MLNAYLDWPEVGQVFRVRRERTIGGHQTVEEVYGITSLKRSQADARELLRLVRQHWGIENRLHYVRDVTMGEDACRVRTGAAPQALAALRNLVVHLLSKVGLPSRAAALRRFAAHPREALTLVHQKHP